MRYDCVIVGGGPAGLSAALMLGRCLRRVLVCDAGEPRNARSRGIHGYLTRDGTTPAEFLATARAEVECYDTVELRSARVADVIPTEQGFHLRLEDGAVLEARKLLLATGVIDELPSIDGLDALYGASIHHCPYCDAWEWRGQPLAAYGKGDTAVGLALALTRWSPDVVLCTDGPADLGAEAVGQLGVMGIRVCDGRVTRLEGRDGALERVVFADGSSVARRAMFLAIGQRQRSALARRLGCTFTASGAVDTGFCESTNVPGVYVAGDASKQAQFVVVAAAEGSEAGMAINKALAAEDLARAGEPRHRSFLHVRP